MAADVRWLGHSAFHLSGGGADVLVDPWLTGNPKAAATADELPADVIAAHARPRRPPRRHGRHRQAHRREGAGDRRAGGRDRGRRRRGRRRLRTSAAPCTFDWGWVKLVPAWHTAVSPDGTAHMPAGLLIHYGGHLIYHLGDTALFSDLKLIAGRGDQVELALVPIGGHYTMDRYDAVTAVEFDQPVPDDPDPLRHVPAGRDRRAGVQVRRPERGLLGSARAQPRRHPHAAMTHAVVLIGAERDVDPRARRPARRRRGRRRGLLRHRRVGLRRDPARAQPGGGRAGRHAPLRRDRRHRAHAHDGRVRGLLPARPRGAVQHRQLVPIVAPEHRPTLREELAPLPARPRWAVLAVLGLLALALLVAADPRRRARTATRVVRQRRPLASTCATRIRCSAWTPRRASCCTSSARGWTRSSSSRSSCPPTRATSAASCRRRRARAGGAQGALPRPRAGRGGQDAHQPGRGLLARLPRQPRSRAPTAGSCCCPQPVPGARDGVKLLMLATPKGGAGKARDVGTRGQLKTPYRSFRFGTEGP